MLYPKTNRYREVLTLDGFWFFCKDENAKGMEEGWFNGIPKTREVAVPSSINELSSDLMDYFGFCWFEKDLFLPKSFRESKVYLRFGGVTGKSTVWVNGKQVTYHREGGTLPFECEISSALHSGENRIVVLSDNSLDQWSLPPAAVVTPEYNDALLGAYPGVTYDFFPYSGIQRSVYLYTCAENRIEDITINTRLDADVAIIDYAIEVSPETNGQILVEVEAQNAIHTLSASAHTIRGSIRVANPRIWDVGVPNMYDMRVALQKNGKEIDEYIQPFGIRTIEVKGNALLLNGKPVYLRGCAKHEDFMVLGKGFHPSLVVRDFELMDWLGANSFRTSHYPYDENVLDYADRHGVLVIDESPLVGFYKRMYTPEVLERSKAIISTMIERDKNHPSVIMWSMANEPDARSKEAVDFFCELQKHTRKCDATRPITYVGYQDPCDNQIFHCCDVVCINKYFGWYLSPGQLDVALKDLDDCLEAFYNEFHKPILVAEFGCDAVAGLHFEPAREWSEEYQSDMLAQESQLIDSKDYTIGTHVWCFADFMVGQSTRRALLSRKGIFTRERQPKMAAHTLRRMWKKGEKV